MATKLLSLERLLQSVTSCITNCYLSAVKSDKHIIPKIFLNVPVCMIPHDIYFTIELVIMT